MPSRSIARDIVGQACRSVRAFVLVVPPLLAACGKAPRQVTWSDLFETGSPTHLSPEATRLIMADTLFDRHGPLVVQRRLSDDLDPDVSVQALREGRLEEASKTTRIGGSARLGGWARYGRELGASYLPRPRVLDATPYWVSLDYHPIAAVMGDRVVVARNLFYPIYVYNSAVAVIDSFTQPPRSWRELRKPEVGEFADEEGSPERRDAFRDWRRSYTMILDLAVLSDSVLVVNHGVYASGSGEVLQERPTVVDVYLEHERIASDLPSPGVILAFSRDALFTLNGAADGAGLQLTEHRWRGSSHLH